MTGAVYSKSKYASPGTYHHPRSMPLEYGCDHGGYVSHKLDTRGSGRGGSWKFVLFYQIYPPPIDTLVTGMVAIAALFGSFSGQPIV